MRETRYLRVFRSSQGSLRYRARSCPAITLPHTLNLLCTLASLRPLSSPATLVLAFIAPCSLGVSNDDAETAKAMTQKIRQAEGLLRAVPRPGETMYGARVFCP